MKRKIKNNSFWATLILSLYLLLALAYGVVNPLFEAPDEHFHFFTIQYIAEKGRLPTVQADLEQWLGPEAAQPPLYYLAGSLLLNFIDTDAAQGMVWPNPFARLGDATILTNINAFVHGPWEQWPWHGYVLAAHLLRFFSSLLGLGTLLAVYGSARLLWPAHPRRALLALSLIAFLPQFIFLHSSITNDILIILFASLALWQCLYLWQQPVTRPRLFLMGLTIGLAALSKMAGFLLLGYVVVFLLLRAWKEQEALLPATVRVGLLVVLPALLLSGWLLWRNWLLYEDPTATNQFVAIAGGDRGYTMREVLAETPSLWLSLFGVFGWFNLRAPDWFYWLWNLLVLVAGGGLLAGLAKRPATGAARERFFRRLLRLLLAAWVLLVYVALVSFMMRTPAAQGRLLFPALVPLALAFAYGLSHISWRRAWLLAPALALFSSVYIPFFVIAPAYAVPVAVNTSDIPPEAHWLETDVGEGLELVAVQLETEEAQPGDTIWATLFWRAREVPQTAPELVLEAFGREGTTEPAGRIHSYHGRGLYPATLWSSGQLLASRVELPLAETMSAPTLARLQLGLDKQSLRVQLGTVKVTPERWPPLPEGQLALLADQVSLVAADIPTLVRPGQTVEIKVIWHVLAAPDRPLTTFVHLGEPGAPPLQTADSPPLSGFYPTDHWAEGEVIYDSYTFSLPPVLTPGRHPVLIGMYDPESFERLPLTASGQRQPNDSYLMGWLTVEAE